LPGAPYLFVVTQTNVLLSLKPTFNGNRNNIVATPLASLFYQHHAYTIYSITFFSHSIAPTIILKTALTVKSVSFFIDNWGGAR
jgi:hypothetical protein